MIIYNDKAMMISMQRYLTITLVHVDRTIGPLRVILKKKKKKKKTQSVLRGIANVAHFITGHKQN